MLRAAVSRPRSGLLGRACRCGRNLSTTDSPRLARKRPNAALISGRKQMAPVAQASRRSYAMVAEDTNKGVVILQLGQEAYTSHADLFPRTRMTLFYKVLRLTTSMKCIWHGKRTQSLYTSHGRPTFATWKTGICPYLKPSSHLLRLRLLPQA